MFTQQDIPALRQQLRDLGGAQIDGPQGKKLYLVLHHVLGVEERGLLVSQESGGTFFFSLDRPINQFRLVQSGFSLRSAPYIVDLVHALFLADTSDKSIQEPMRLAQRAAPQGQ